MIRRLRGEFIRIAMLAVSLVLLLLTVSVNAVNYISVSRQQDRTLEMIVSHQGTIPAMPKEAKSGPRPNGHFSPETPYDTRFFVLRYTDSGDLTQSDLTHIASVTEADTEPYLQAALSHGEGGGWQSGYRFRVVRTGENRWMAVFLDCRKEVRSLYRRGGGQRGGHGGVRGAGVSDRGAAEPTGHGAGGAVRPAAEAVHHRCRA